MPSCCGGPLRCPGLGSKGRVSTHPPALPVGKGAGRCAPWSPRRFFLQGHFGCAADRSPLHCPGLGSKVRLSTHPPALPVGKGAGRCAPWSPRRFFLQGHFGSAADRSPLHCPGLGSKGRVSTHPPALPVGKGAGRCAPMWPLVGVASGLFVAVRQWSVVRPSCRRYAGGRAGSVPVRAARPFSVTP